MLNKRDAMLCLPVHAELSTIVRPRSARSRLTPCRALDAEVVADVVPDDCARRLRRLVSEPSDSQRTSCTLDELQTAFPFAFDKFQKRAVQGLLDGKSVVVSAPTGSGKTLVAEAAILAVLAAGKRAFYTTPLKALSNQKLCEFRKRFGHDVVGLRTGDCAINTEARLVVLTTEILRNMCALSRPA